MNQNEKPMRSGIALSPTLAFSALWLLASACPASAQQAVSFNGYVPGVTKAKAKSMGYEACEYVSLGEPDSSIRCKVPSASTKLAGLPVSSAYLIFKAPKHEKVDSIEVTIAATPDEIQPALRGHYGPRYKLGRNFYTYIGNNDVTVSYYARTQTAPTVLSYRHEPGSYAQLRQAEQAHAEREKRLKNF